jgi:glutamate N-acetyltransferase / amino-acid N-acetyltransferase
MTTDKYTKESLAEIRVGGKAVRVGAMGKGAGMIAPNMATMLGFVTTDAEVEPELLRRTLVEAVGESFNRITVDGDTSTNDMVLLLASGAAGARIASGSADLDAFRAALTKVCRDIAQLIVKDGEGATRIAEVRVEGAGSTADADRIARTVAESPLVKTALNGADANWGRVLGAVGRGELASAPPSRPLGRCMPLNPPIVASETPIEDARRLMEALGIDCLVVTAGPLLVGLVTRDDLEDGDERAAG